MIIWDFDQKGGANFLGGERKDGDTTLVIVVRIKRHQITSFKLYRVSPKAQLILRSCYCFISISIAKTLLLVNYILNRAKNYTAIILLHIGIKANRKVRNRLSTFGN